MVYFDVAFDNLMSALHSEIAGMRGALCLCAGLQRNIFLIC
jgi:hypothetical protein